MQLHDLRPAEGSTKARKRIGRGHATGQGKTAGKGHKGQWARSGGGVRPGFEGGQTSLSRRTPKRGFNNLFAKEYAVINIFDLIELFDDGAEISAKTILESGFIKKPLDGIKILGDAGFKIDCDCEKAEGDESVEGAEENHEHTITPVVLDKKFNIKVNILKITKPNKSKKNPEAPVEKLSPDLLLSKSAKTKILEAGGKVEEIVKTAREA